MQDLLNKKNRIALFFAVLVSLGSLVFLLDALFVDDSTDYNPPVIDNVDNTEVFFEGSVTYIDPSFYPEDKVSYVLTNDEGEDIILLRAHDQKLEVSEGLYVRVYGTVIKAKDGKTDILIVDRIVVNNAPN